MTTNFQAAMTALAVWLFARWSQENFFQNRREHYSFGSSGVIRANRLLMRFRWSIRSDAGQPDPMDRGSDTLKQQHRQTPNHIPHQVPGCAPSASILSKLIGYRADTSLASLLREHLARSYDTRVLLRQIFQDEGDLLPASVTNALAVRLHHFTQAVHELALAQLCARLNETQTFFLGTNLKLIFESSSKISPDQEVC